MLSLPRLLTRPSPRHKMLRLPRKCKMSEQKVLRLPRENNDTPLKYCACHAQRENDLPLWEFEAPKRAFRARLPRVFIRLLLRIDEFMRVFLFCYFHKAPKVLVFARLAQLFKAVTKCFACHDFWHCVMFAQPWHCDSWKSTLDTPQNAAPATQVHNAALQSAAPATRKRHACIDTLPKYCACHAKRENDLPSCDILWLWSAKTSISCETSFKFHTSDDISQNTSGSCLAWQWINDATTTPRRRHDAPTTNTTRTQVQPQTPTINGNPSLRIREKTHLANGPWIKV